MILTFPRIRFLYCVCAFGKRYVQTLSCHKLAYYLKAINTIDNSSFTIIKSFFLEKSLVVSLNKTYLCSMRTRQASLQCLNRRVVFYMESYAKKYSSPAQLTALLQSRGLHVENVARA